jgi:hypothetical protein
MLRLGVANDAALVVEACRLSASESSDKASARLG